MIDLLFPMAMAADTAGAPDTTINIIMIAALILLMYLLLFRPQRKRQKEHRELVSKLALGDEVVLSSGLLGKVTHLDEDYVTLQAGKQEGRSVDLVFQKVAVHAVLPKGTLKSIGSA